MPYYHLPTIKLPFQGMKIIDHRLQVVNKNLEDLNLVLNNIEKKTEFAEELNNTVDSSAFEIKEVCNGKLCRYSLL